MKQKLFICLILIFGLFSCKKVDNSSKLSGTYTESSPVDGRTQLDFSNNGTLIKSEVGTSIEDVFNYELIGNTLKLIPDWATSQTSELDITIINRKKFEIENLYPSIPENPKTYMTFEK